MPIMGFIIGLPARAHVSLYPVTRTCTVMLLPVTFIPVIGDVIATCMCLAPIGSIPPPIDMDGLAIGIELDISGIGDLEWAPAAEVVPDEPHAAASSASAPTPALVLRAEPGRGRRPGDRELFMSETSTLPTRVWAPS